MGKKPQSQTRRIALRMNRAILKRHVAQVKFLGFTRRLSAVRISAVRRFRGIPKEKHNKDVLRCWESSSSSLEGSKQVQIDVDTKTEENLDEVLLWKNSIFGERY